MKTRANLEFRRYEENSYDFVSKEGKRVQGTSKTYVFLTEEDKIIKVKHPKDSALKFELHKGDEVEALLKATLKPVVDKESGRVDESNFYASFELLDIVPFKSVGRDVPVEQTDKQDKKKNDKGGMF